jgi:integration host factor subunit beta
MIKSELVTRIAEQNPHLYNREFEKIVNAILDQIVSAMTQGNRVELRGFGTFSVRVRRARTGRDPRTGTVVDVAEKVMPHFKAGKDILNRLNLIAPDAKTNVSLRAT